MNSKWGIWFLISSLWLSCGDKSMSNGPNIDPNDLTHIEYNPSDFNLNIPDNFPQMDIPSDNPNTVEGVDLGRRLFYDPILSVDSTLSCSSCHLPVGNFTDNLALSLGVSGNSTIRSSMTLLNIGFVNSGLFWDGRSDILEHQALLPVEDPVELEADWIEIEQKLRNNNTYPSLFRKAFGIENILEIDRELASKAIAQFERTLISSGNSKYDQVIRGDAVFTDQELQGHDIFFDIDEDINRHAECGHCHNAPLFTTNEYFNNGIQTPVGDNTFKDNGLGEISGNLFDNGMMRTPTLRNIFHSAPYMHDGRFETLDEVIDHYITGGHPTDNLAPVLRPLTMSDEDRAALIAFIRTLEDLDFINNPDHQNPF
ncbi:MAG: cytochrome c peroxidase [Saprospiraceae bacterium]|nr:cytochrome c peroxidase [Saprospiraceae bacterium]